MAETSSDKQEAILKTALRLFVERGFFSTPTSLISKEAGVATGTLFFYFKTKEDLIDTIYLRVKAEAAEEMCRGLAEEPDARAKLNRLGRNAIAWGTTRPDEVKFMEQFAHTPFISKSAQEEGMSRFFFLKDLILEGKSEGLICDSDPEILIFMMASAFAGLIGRIGMAASEDEREQLIEEGLDFVWNGLAAKNRENPPVQKQKNTRKM